MKRRIYIARTGLTLMMLPLISACDIFRPVTYRESDGTAATSATAASASASASASAAAPRASASRPY